MLVLVVFEAASENFGCSVSACTLGSPTRGPGSARAANPRELMLMERLRALMANEFPTNLPSAVRAPVH